MNALPPSPPRAPTQAAEGLPRWRWTVAELERLAELGAFRDEDRFELIGGEIVPMSPKGRRHEIIRGKLAYLLTKLAPPGVFVIAEAQLNLGDDSYALPDILVHPASIQTPDVRGPTALLVIEISDSSLGYDLNMKALLYAAHGAPEYWVINARTLNTTAHRGPSAAGYARADELASTDRLTPALVPAFAVTLSDLGIE